jgi:hypothetical protein
MKLTGNILGLTLIFLFSCSPEEDFYPNGLPIGSWQLKILPGTPEVEPNRILSRSFISGLEMRKNFTGNLTMTTDVYEGLIKMIHLKNLFLSNKMTFL